MYFLEIIGEPVAKGRPRFTRKGFPYTPEKTSVYENLVKTLFYQKYGQLLLKDELEVEIDLYFQIPKSASKKKKSQMLNKEIRPQKRPDLDNCMKAILDSLNGVAYEDDKQITKATVEKFWSDKPRAELCIKKRKRGKTDE